MFCFSHVVLFQEMYGDFLCKLVLTTEMSLVMNYVIVVFKSCIYLYPKLLAITSLSVFIHLIPQSKIKMRFKTLRKL